MRPNLVNKGVDLCRRVVDQQRRVRLGRQLRQRVDVGAASLESLHQG